jgi:hypothetical protein
LFSKISDPYVVRTRAVATRSLTENGTPCKGGNCVPVDSAFSASRAAASAGSAQTVTNAFRIG